MGHSGNQKSAELKNSTRAHSPDERLLDKSKQPRLARQVRASCLNPHPSIALGSVLRGKVYSMHIDFLLGVACVRQNRSSPFVCKPIFLVHSRRETNILHTHESQRGGHEGHHLRLPARVIALDMPMHGLFHSTHACANVHLGGIHCFSTVSSASITSPDLDTQTTWRGANAPLVVRSVKNGCTQQPARNKSKTEFPLLSSSTEFFKTSFVTSRRYLRKISSVPVSRPIETSYLTAKQGRHNDRVRAHTRSVCSHRPLSRASDIETLHFVVKFFAFPHRLPHLHSSPVRVSHSLTPSRAVLPQGHGPTRGRRWSSTSN